jgi:putative ABC transport system permease protein
MRAFRLLLHLFPASFRDRFGHDMEELFADRRRAARQAGRRAVAALWVRTAADLIAHGAAERRAARAASLTTRRGATTTMQTIVQDIRFAIRMFRQRPAVTAVALVTLALGIGANTAIFSVVHAVLIRRLPYAEPSRIVRIYATHRLANFTRGVANPFDFDYWQQHATSFSRLAVMNYEAAALTGSGDPVQLRGQSVMPAFFEILGAHPSTGRLFTADEARDQARVVVISDRIWRSRFGGRDDVVGRTIELNERPWTVIGVMPPDWSFPSNVDFWQPSELTPAERRQLGSWYLGVIAQLAPGVTIADAQREMDRLARDLEAAYPRQRANRGFSVVSLRDDLASRSADGLRLLQGVVICVLLIACANLANVQLAQAIGRRREFGVRSAVGASRTRLMRQALTESVVLALAGAAIGAVVAIWGVRALVALAPPFVLPDPDSIGVSWQSLAATGAIAIATGFIFGAGPAWLLSSPGVAGAVAHGTRTAAGGLTGSLFRRRQWPRAGLVAAEIAIAFVLLAGASLLIRSFITLSHQPPGFRTDHLITAQITVPTSRYQTAEARLRFWESVNERLAALPGVVAATGSNAIPFTNWDWANGFAIKGRDEVPNDGASVRSVLPSYFATLGVPLRSGRSFTAEDTATSPHVAIVTDAFVREHMQGLDPIGQQITFSRSKPDWITVIGVVGATRHRGLDEDLRSEIYRPASQHEAMNTFLYALRTSTEPAAFAPAIRQAVQQLDPNLPVLELKTMDELIAATIAERRFYLTLLSLFAAIAGGLAVVGIYGVMSYVVGQGRKEIAIRLALGARPVQVRRGVLAHGLQVVIAGSVAGAIGAWKLSSLLQSQLFRTTTHDAAAFLGAAALLAGVAALACWIPAARTSRVDPIGALHAE